MSEIDTACAALFPGQGSQYPGMADPWTEHPVGLETLREASEATGLDIIAGCHEEDLLRTTSFVQPALLACQVAAFRILTDEGVRFEAAAGHSLGEFSALVAAGVVTMQEALDVVNVRAKAMEQAGKTKPGTMSALVKVGVVEATELCDEAAEGDVLVVANHNSPDQVVISGTVPAIERAEAKAKSRGIRAIRLAVAGAFHSALMLPAFQPIIDELDKVELCLPRFPIAENVSGELVDDPVMLRSLLERHVVSSVRWEECVRALGAAGITTYVEVAGRTLNGLTRRILPDVMCLNVRTIEDVISTSATLAS